MSLGYIEASPGDDPQLTDREARLLTWVDPDLTEADIQFEDQLLDEVADTSAGQLQQPLGVPKTNRAPLSDATSNASWNKGAARNK